MSQALALTPAQEDYLEIILALAREHRVARVRDIARSKGVRMASVSDALKRLSGQGLVDYQAREFVQLTAEGEAQAQRVAGRHDFLRRFFTEILLLDPETAERDACTVEHHLSPATVERLASFYQFVQSCPETPAAFLEDFARCLQPRPAPARPSEDNAHGDKGCAACNGHGSDAECQLSTPLDTLKAGQAGTVRRILSQALVSRRLVEMGVLPGTRIEVEGFAPLGDPMRVKVRGYRLSLRREEASAIMVQPELV